MERSFSASELSKLGIAVRQDGRRASLFDWLRYPEVVAYAGLDQLRDAARQIRGDGLVEMRVGDGAGGHAADGLAGGGASAALPVADAELRLVAGGVGVVAIVAWRLVVRSKTARRGGHELSPDEIRELFFDATERAIPRPTRGQKRFYSGKKKKHTVKHQVVVVRKKKRPSASVRRTIARGKCETRPSGASR